MATEQNTNLKSIFNRVKELVENGEDIDDTTFSHVKKLCEKHGIPSELRSVLWKKLITKSESRLNSIRTMAPFSSLFNEFKDFGFDSSVQEVILADMNQIKDSFNGSKTCSDNIQINDDIMELANDVLKLHIFAHIRERKTKTAEDSLSFYNKSQCILCLVFLISLNIKNYRGYNYDPTLLEETFESFCQLLRLFTPLSLIRSSYGSSDLTVKGINVIYHHLLQYHDPILTKFLDSRPHQASAFFNEFVPSIITSMFTGVFLPNAFSPHTSNQDEDTEIPPTSFSGVQAVIDRLLMNAVSQPNNVKASYFCILPYFILSQILMDNRDEVTATEPDHLEFVIMRIFREFFSYNIQDNDSINRFNTRMKELFDHSLNMFKDTPHCTLTHLLAVSFPERFKKVNMKGIIEKYERSLVLPLTAAEVLTPFFKPSVADRVPRKKVNTNIEKYIIIDCRSLRSFYFARLPTAVHVGQDVSYDQEKLGQMLQRFDDAKGSHFCVFGTGRNLTEEENLLKLISTKFLQADFPHVSIMMGGFKECAKYISNGEIEFVRDEDQILKYRQMEQKQKQQQQQQQQEQQGGKTITSEEESDSISSSLMRSVYDFSKKMMQNFEDDLSDSQHQRSNITRSDPFSLSHDDDDNNDENRFNVKDNQDCIHLDSLRDQVAIFHGELSNEWESRYLCIGPHFIMALRMHPTREDCGTLLWRHSLRNLRMIQFSKSQPSTITLCMESSSSKFEETYHIDNYQSCIDTLQRSMTQFKDYLTHSN